MGGAKKDGVAVVVAVLAASTDLSLSLLADGYGSDDGTIGGREPSLSSISSPLSSRFLLWFLLSFAAFFFPSSCEICSSPALLPPLRNGQQLFHIEPYTRRKGEEGREMGKEGKEGESQL